MGLRPGTEVIHPIAATGKRPLHFAVSGLPPGIDVDEQGILRGTAPASAGDHPLTVHVSNGLGTIEATLELRVGDTLALTPPDAAELTCGGCFGGYGYEDVDARAYAAWGVDLLKYDYCHAPAGRPAAVERYGAMGRALAGSGRSIVLSVCEWGMRRPWRWAPQVGASSWRTTGDIFDTFTWPLVGVRSIARRTMRLADFAGPGRWNDPDMLLVGNRDLTSTSGFDLDLLRNPEVLAVNQDLLGQQARRRRSKPGTWLLTKPLADGRFAVSLTNLSGRPRSVEVDLAGLGLPEGAEVLDAWSMIELGHQRSLSARLPGHGSVVYTCRPATAGS